MQPKKIMLNASCILMLVALLASCNNNEKEVPAGGPCNYDNVVISATLVKIVSRDSVQFDAIFKLTGGTDAQGKDTLYYANFNTHTAMMATNTKRDSLVLGRQYSYNIQNIKSGSCNPHVEYLTLDPYPAK